MYYDEIIENAINTSPINKKNATTKQLDHNYEKFSIPFYKTWKDGKYYKKITIEIYGSGQTGAKIRNAVTSQRYPYIVGSSDEDLFFKISDSTGRQGRKYPLILFYDSPEQYENQHFTTLDTDIKHRWQEKNLVARKRLRFA